MPYAFRTFVIPIRRYKIQAEESIRLSQVNDVWKTFSLYHMKERAFPPRILKEALNQTSIKQ